MNKWTEILLGLILIVAPILVAGYTTWGVWPAALAVLKGGIFWILAGLGVLFLLLGISDLKE